MGSRGVPPAGTHGSQNGDEQDLLAGCVGAGWAAKPLFSPDNFFLSEQMPAIEMSNIFQARFQVESVALRI